MSQRNKRNILENPIWVGIGAIAGIIAVFVALIAFIVPAHSGVSVQPTTYPTSPPVATQATQPTSPPVPTQTAQPTYPDIRGTYGLISQNTVTGYEVALNFVITQQNQQSFQGILSKDNRSTNINNGTVDKNGDIQFTSLVPAFFFSTGADTGNQTSVTYTGTPQSGGGWQGTWSATDGSQGTWTAM